MFVHKPMSFRLDGDIEKSATDTGEIGTFSGYASVFGNRDLDGDVVMPGAFPASIDPKSVKMLRQHKHSDLIGVWKTIKPDEHGVYVKGAINLDVQLGRETYSLMKQGALDQMSVGMRVPRTGIEEKEIDGDGGKRRVRHIKSASLYEISLVTIAANPAARITEVKSVKDMPTLREFEAVLRDADFSRKERAELAHEYKTLLKKCGFERDADTDDDAVRDAGRAAEEAAKAKAEADALAEKAAREAEAIATMLKQAFGDVVTGLRL